MMTHAIHRPLLLLTAVFLLAMPAMGDHLPGAIPPRERQALIDLYEATDGEDWINREGWLGPPGTECHWHGIDCGCLDEPEGGCPVVYELSLEENNLNGSIPRSIRAFSHLRILKLGANRLRGELPNELGRLRRLRWLSLSDNQLTGEIPRDLGALTRLQWLAISTNRLVGPLPNELAGLQNLAAFYLDDNQLTGELPRWLGSLPKLSSLGLSSNHFSGRIPSEIFNAGRLRDLSLAFNHLAGRIPAEIGKPDLNVIYLQGNNLSGPVPETVLDLDFLSYIDVGWNALYPSNPEVEQLLMERGGFIGWAYTQTVAPENLLAVATSPTSVRLTWSTALRFPGILNEAGGYLIYVKDHPGDRFRRVKTIRDKSLTMVDLTDLAPGTTYTFGLRTFSRPHRENLNVVRSEMSAEVTITTPRGQQPERKLP
jgi:Leucine rich repeat/Fibronectin type III domain